jgi:[ribosomal protein S5]-alanine N-acetyltransferase
MIKIETNRLKLRRFTSADLDELAKINAEPKTRGFMWEGSKDREATARDLARWKEEYEQSLGHLGMVYKPDGELIGHCGLTEKDGRIVLSYALRADYWCKGLAPEACTAMLRYGFEQLGLEEIETGTRAENRAWQGMMEKLGLTLREVGCGEDGEKEVHYAATREEFLGTPASKG